MASVDNSKNEMAHQQCDNEESLDPEAPTETLAKMIQYSQDLQYHGVKLNKQLDTLMDNVLLSHTKAEEELEVQFQKVEFIIRSWKCEFDQELSDLFRRQKTDVQRQIDHLQEISSTLSKALLRAKVSMAANLESLTEDHCLSHLEELMEPAQEIMDVKLMCPSPFSFISNELFHMRILKPEDRHKIGYIQHLPMEPKDMVLVQVFDALQDQSSVVFKIEVCDENQEYEGMLKNSLSWDLRMCENANIDNVKTDNVKNNKEKNPPYNIYCTWLKGEILFNISVSQQCAHQFSVYLYNQNISGSPQFFTPSSYCTVIDKEKSLQETEPAHTEYTENIYMISETPETVGTISHKDVSAISNYLEKAKMENSYMEKCRKEAEQHLDGALINNNHKDTNLDESLTEASPENELGIIPVNKEHLDVSPVSDKLVVRKGRPNTFTPLRRPKQQETIKLDLDSEVKVEAELNLGSTTDFTPTFSSTSKLPMVDDLESFKLCNGDCVSFGEKSSTVGNLTKLLANVVEVKQELQDNQVDQNSKNVENGEDFNEINRQEVDAVVHSDLNANLIGCDEPQPHGGQLLINANTVQSFSKPESVDEVLLKEFDIKEENLHGISVFQKGIYAQLRLKMSLPKENALNKPIGVAQLKTGAVIIADTFNDRMVLFTAEGYFQKSFRSSHMKRPSAIAVMLDGRFAVKDNHSIIIFTEEGEYVEHLKHATSLNHPYGLTMDDNGNLLTIETTRVGCVTIVVMDPIGSCSLSRISVPLGLSAEQAVQSKPRFIAYQGHNTVLVVDLGLNCIYRIIYSTAGGVVANTIGSYGVGKGQFWDPSGIVVDAEGFIMVGDSRNHRVQVFDQNGDFVSVLHLDTPLRRPSGLCLTPCGHLLILNYWENTLAKYQLTL